MTTSQPSVGDFLAVYEPLLAEGREIVSIHLSAGISGTYETAVQARDSSSRRQGRRADPRRGLEDGRRRNGDGGAGGGQRSRRGRGSGRGGRRARAGARDSAQGVVRGGHARVPAPRRPDRGRGRWIGSTLKIKPILTFEEEVTPVERVRTRSRAIERLVGYARQRHEDGADAWVVQHIQDPETAAS